MIQPNQVVILDGGTTSREIARHRPQALKATVVTHSPHHCAGAPTSSRCRGNPDRWASV
jgi:DeoR/GlpR family transcriptional regulator of sugar metabolism